MVDLTARSRRTFFIVMNELVFKGQNDQVLTNSLLVAEKFGKEHKHVLDAIRELIKGCAETSALCLLKLFMLMNKIGKNTQCS